MARARKGNKGNSSVDSTLIDAPSPQVPETVKPVDPSAEYKARRWYEANGFNMTPWEYLTDEYKTNLLKRYSAN